MAERAPGVEHRVVIEHYDDLTKDELYQIMVLRNLVFVVGQGITVEPEVDGRDPECAHAMLWEGDELLGTARLFVREEPVVVGRVAVHPERQRQGLGSVLMEAVQAHLGARSAELHAQAHLEAWYARLGWTRIGEVFEEAEIPHVMMCWDGSNG